MRITDIVLEAESLLTTSQEFRDNLGVLLGRIETVGKISTARDRNSREVGTYDAETNVTRNYNGVKVGTGNLLGSLFLTFTKS